MKTTFDLPDPLLRRAKAAAAAQGRPLRDLVAEAIEARLAAPPPALQRRSEPPADEWKAFLATLELQPDGSYINPNVSERDTEAFFEALEEIRDDRLRGQAASFPPAPTPERSTGTPKPRRPGQLRSKA